MWVLLLRGLTYLDFQMFVDLFGEFASHHVVQCYINIKRLSPHQFITNPSSSTSQRCLQSRLQQHKKLHGYNLRARIIGTKIDLSYDLYLTHLVNYFQEVVEDALLQVSDVNG